MRQSRLILLLGIVLLLTLTGVRCRKGTPPEVAQANRPITLNWWRTFDDEVAVRPIIEAYQVLHPNVAIRYRKLRFEEYEQALLDALAEDRGPDIFSLHSSWIRRYQSKLAPLPDALTIPFPEVRGTFKKEVVVTLKTTPALSVRALKERFVDAVAADVLISTSDERGGKKEQIFGLPLALDTLALFSNRDLLNRTGIPEAPKTWSEMQSAVKRLTKLDREGNLLQSGAALGSARNVERATDILALLMMQNGAEMLDLSGAAAFHKIPPLLQGLPTPPGEQALTFYTDFANPQKEVYSWSAREPNALEAFISGRTAMMLGYAYHLSIIRARAPRLNLAVSPAPQIEGNPEVNFANYWIETVSRKSPNAHFAWDFLQFATSAERVTRYLEATGRPPALRALISSLSEKEYTGVFAAQALTAKSWYRGGNARAAEAALLDAIDATLSGGEVRKVLSIAAQRVNQTLR